MSALLYRLLFPALWVGWAAYWVVSARALKSNVRKESALSRAQHGVPLAIAGILLWSDKVPWQPLNEPLFPWAPWQFYVAALITAAGLGFAVWARMHIGTNWSATVTLKEDHELVTTGPYSLVRHPIYTGLLTAIIGSALARDEWRGVLAILIAWAAIWRKLRLEEKWMLEVFGESYSAYYRRVPALIPFMRGSAK